jgi:hypothetical protein
MRLKRPHVLFAAASATAVVGTMALTVPAVAADGDANPWAPYTACPVDSPAMLQADISGYGITCVAASSPHGTFTIGDTVVTTGATDVQFGVAGSERKNGFPDAPSSLGNVVPGADGQTLVAEPASVPGGLLDLEHALNPNGGAEPVGLGGLIGKIGQTVDSLLGVKAQVELAGAPRDFNALAALLANRGPVFTLPVKIHLISPALGNNCYIGTDKNPIVLKPETLARGGTGGDSVQFDRDGKQFGVAFIDLSGGTLGDDSFAVPAATGCGFLGLLNGAVNGKVGLPSPAGNNSLVLEDASAHTAVASSTQVTPADFAWAWHQGMD